MQYRKLGSTNIELSAIGLGSMPLSIDGRPSENDAIKVIHAAIDLGVNFIDTANVYCLDNSDIGHNEKLITKALKQLANRDKIYIATKGGLERPNGDWITNATPDTLVKSCEQSLKDLEVECIDLYQLHAPGSEAPFADIIGTLEKLKTAGKIQHIGLSNVSLKQIKTAREITEIQSIQNRCNVLDRRAFDEGIVEYCETNSLTFIPYSPVCGRFGKEKLQEQEGLLKLAKQNHVSVYQIALAWLTAKSPCIIPIPGATKISSITDSVRSLELNLDAC